MPIINERKVKTITNKEILAQAERVLKLKNYSRKTIKAYLGYPRRFMECTEVEIAGLNAEQVTDYIYLYSNQQPLHQ